MPKTNYLKRTINSKEYYYFRLRHKNLRKPKDVYATTVKELDKKIRIIRNELENNIVNNKECFETFFANWLFDVKFLQIKASTQERYEILYRKYIKNSELSLIKIKDISLNDIQCFYSKLLKNGTSVSCIINVHKLVAPCIRYAYGNNIIIKEFTKSIILPKEDEKTKLNKETIIQPFTLDEQKRFVNAIKDHELEMLFLTALNSGLRQGELFALTWNDINFNECYIDVNKSAKGVTEVIDGERGSWKTIIQTPKTKGSIRKVSIPKSLIEKLNQYRVKQIEQRLLLANLYEDNNLVFCTPTGKYHNSSNVRKRFNNVLKNMNDNEKDNHKIITPKRFHDLRHTYATRLFELGENPKTVQTLLGHSNITTTLNTYTHVLTNMKENVAVKLDELYKTM